MNDDEGCADGVQPSRPGRWRRGELFAAATLAAAAGTAAIVASRHGPLLSPDSVTYLATAEHLHRGRGFMDFSGEPMTVFGPVYPLVLAPGGASLGWVRATGAIGAALVTLACFALARRRSTAPVALAAAAVVALAASTVLVAGTAWSETAYTAIGLAMLLVLTAGRPTTWRCAGAGALAGLGFLTRYAGAGLVLTGALALLLGSDIATAWRARLRAVVVFGAAAALTIAPWVVRNLAATGEALGPRFSGGTDDGLGTLLHRPVIALGRVVTGDHWDSPLVHLLGWAAVAAIGSGVVLVIARVTHRRSVRTFDVAAVALAATCVVVPVLARALTANDIEQRVMSPTFSALVLLVVIAVETARTARLRVVRFGTPVLAATLALASLGRGVVEVADFPDLVPASSANRGAFSPQLHDAIDALPPDVHLLTNSPQRVWWQNRREPTLFAFTQPRAGNSHYPLPADDVVALACDGDTYLAWFSGLLNAGGGPEERRPDLLEVVRLDVVETMPGGTLYAVATIDPGVCPPRST